MRKALILPFLLFLSSLTSAQVPESFSYQVVVRDGLNPLTNKDVSFQMSILKGGTSGDAVYTEYHSANTGELGIVNLVIGNGTGKVGDIAAIDWGSDSYFLKVSIDKTGGTTYVEMGSIQLLSVPYALYAKSASTSDALQSQINMLKNSSAAGGVISDLDNNLYNIIKIGTQVWMAENLKTTKYNDGTPIPNITDNTAWAALTSGAYSDYDNTPANTTIYGRLYNWYAVDNNTATKMASNGGKNVCPTGWHMPSYTEWMTLTSYLTNNGYGFGGSGSDIAKSMASTSGWTKSVTVGTVGNDQASNNSSGFTALPGGYRNFYGPFAVICESGYWWSSTELSSSDSYFWFLHSNDSQVGSSNDHKQAGFSVRCIKD